MFFLLRALRLMAMVVWVGGLIFFAFVLAPVAFRVLPSTHEAGLVVAGTLATLHSIALASGIVFLLATTLLGISRKTRADRRLFAELCLVLLMMTATAYVQRRIVPTMEHDRIAAGGDIDAAAPDNPARLDFERLHPLSEKVEGAVLFLGLAVVALMAAERTPA